MKFTTKKAAKEFSKVSYLGTTSASAKMEKSVKINGVLTYSLYLAPYKESGYNVCSHATKECILGCLATSGRAKMDLISGRNIIKDARVKKSRLFFEHQSLFMNWLIAEIKTAENKAKKMNYGFAIRLNGTSDIDWANVLHNDKSIFDHFPNVSFYDYTKNASKFDTDISNYHLTLSYTGHNWNKCKTVLDNKNNVAIVFNIDKKLPLPKTFNGYKVINGDITDLRIKDEKGIIVGLYWKKIANKELNNEVKNSIFAIQQNDQSNEF